MICYKDKTFCPFDNCKKFNDCPEKRALTQEIKDGADRWWGKDGAPIAMFASEPECYDPKFPHGY